MEGQDYLETDDERMGEDKMPNRRKELSCVNGKRFLQDAFRKEQGLLMAALDLSAASITHDGKRGDVDEKHFIDTLRRYLPNRYAVDSAIVIDSTGRTSDQIDVVVYDRQYTPTLLDQQDHKYVPAEAVYAIFEVKPKIDKTYLEYAGRKAQSVRSLKRTSVAIAHAGGTFPPKPHASIIAGIVAARTVWTDGFGSSFKAAYRALGEKQRIDCGLAVSGHCFDTFGDPPVLTFGPKENAMVFFLFRLLRKLQSLGTVPAIDWDAYANQLGRRS